MSGLRIQSYTRSNADVYSDKGALLHTLSLHPVTIFPPILHTYLHLHATIIRRTSGRSLRTFYQPNDLWKYQF
jgi:hypothetical protein